MNKLYQGDCLEVMKDIDDKSIDMILCDLPYGTTACKWDTIIPFEPLWEQYKRIIKDNGAIVLTSSQPFTTDLINSARDIFKYEWIWDKVSGKDFYQAKKRPLKQHENILIFSKGNTIYNPQMYEADKKNIRDRIKNNTKAQQDTIYGDLKEYTSQKDERKRYPGSIFIHSYQENELHYSKRLHNTQKPVALFEYLIKTYTNEGDLVLDNCAGSGTTGVACKNTNRNFILIEQDEKYCEVIKERVGCEIIKGEKGIELECIECNKIYNSNTSKHLALCPECGGKIKGRYCEDCLEELNKNF
jgi:site-specific DNA-methyltransferase (adenine-specific)